MIKKILIVFIIFTLLLQTGCWNKRELESLGYVVLMIIDRNQENEVNCYFGVVKPEELSKTGGGGGDKRPSVLFRSSGRTVFEAIRNALMESSRRLFFGHQMIYIITERAVTHSDVSNILDMPLRDGEFRRQLKIFITPHTAQEMLKVQPELEKLVAQELNQVVEKSDAISKFPNINLNDFTKVLASDVPNPIAPLLIIKEGIEVAVDKPNPKVFFVQGAAVFKKERFAGELDTITTRGWMWVEDKVKGGILVVPSNDKIKKPVSLEITGSKTKIEPDLKGDVPSVNVKVETEVNIGEEMGHEDFTKPENLKKLELSAAQAIEDEIQKVIDKAQLDLRIDFFGLGEDVHRKYKEYWKTHKDQWEDIFPDMKVTVDVTVKIRRMGLITEPLKVR